MVVVVALNKINPNETLRTSYPKINAAIDAADRADINANEAKNIANQALANSESTQEQLDQIVIEGDSSVEAAQARVDADGNSHTTLKERLDYEHNELSLELDQKEQQINTLFNNKFDKDLIPYVNVKEYGALGGANNDTEAIQNAIDDAVARGISDVVIPYPEITINSIDAKQRIIKGNNTKINSGVIRNVKKFVSCTINNIDYDFDFQEDMPAPIPVSTKAIERLSEDRYYVVSRLPYSNKYVMFLLERGIVTTTNSVGGDAELLRPTFVYNINHAYVYAHARNGYGGTWEEWSYRIDSNDTVYRNILFWRNSSRTLNDYLRFDITVPENGEFNLMFYSTPSSDPAARITVDNVEVGTVDLQSFDGRILIRTFKAPPGTRQVRIYTSGNYYIYVAGYNAYKVGEAPSRVYIDSLAFSGGGNPYISNKGAMEYAFYDADENVYYGSYHGGETLIDERVQLDGENSGIVVGDVVVRKSFAIKQTTNIHNKFTSNTLYQIRGDGLLEFTANITGNANLATAYNCMTTTNNAFNQVLFPKKVSTIQEGETYLGRTNKVIQENPNTGQKITTMLTLFKNDNNALGGVFIRRTDGAYNKVYYGKVVQSLENIRELSFQTKWLFE